MGETTGSGPDEYMAGRLTWVVQGGESGGEAVDYDVMENAND